MNAVSNVVLVSLLLWGAYSGWTAFRKAPKSSIGQTGAGRGTLATDAQKLQPTRGWFSSAPVARKEAPLRPESAILIYGIENDISTKITEEALKMRGFSQSIIVPFNVDQFHDLGMTEALKASGLVDAKGNVGTPFISVDGELYSLGALVAGLSHHPLTRARERETPYIVIYGPEGCPFTRQGREELDANGIPYEVRDVNDPRYRPHFEALIRAYDFKYINWPMLDINGKMFSKPSLEVVRANYR